MQVAIYCAYNYIPKYYVHSSSTYLYYSKAVSIHEIILLSSEKCTNELTTERIHILWHTVIAIFVRSKGIHKVMSIMFTHQCCVHLCYSCTVGSTSSSTTGAVHVPTHFTVQQKTSLPADEQSSTHQAAPLQLGQQPQMSQLQQPTGKHTGNTHKPHFSSSIQNAS